MWLAEEILLFLVLGEELLRQGGSKYNGHPLQYEEVSVAVRLPAESLP